MFDLFIASLLFTTGFFLGKWGTSHRDIIQMITSVQGENWRFQEKIWREIDEIKIQIHLINLPKEEILVKRKPGRPAGSKNVHTQSEHGRQHGEHNDIT